MPGDQQPIMVGVGQYSARPEDLARAPHPVEMMAMAARTAAEDAKCPALLTSLEVVVVVNVLSWAYPDPAGLLAEMVGAQPTEKVYTSIGGNTPQLQVNDLGDRIAAGEIQVALLAGAEAMYSARRAQKTGVRLPWPPRGGSPAVSGETRWGNTSHELAHRAQMPTQVYPLFENALRAHRGQSMRAQNEMLGRFCARFAAVARDNPYAWFRDGKTAGEISSVTAENRMIGFPYPKYMNAIMEVDQAAALLLTNVATAKRMGIPPERWVYLWGSGDATDHWFLGDRVDFHSSPAIRVAGREAMQQAGVSIGDVEHFDLYSCFPCAPQIGAAMLGISPDDPRPLTVTGGLAYAGGPGNNYSTHAIAAMSERLRAKPGSLGLVSGVGWYMTKHAVGIYGSAAPPAPRRRRLADEGQREVDGMPHPAHRETPAGSGRVETYTVLHDRDGTPETGLVVGILDSGERFWANTPADPGLLEKMEKEEFIGQRGRVQHDAATGLNRFDP